MSLDQHKQAYKEETYELLSRLESDLLSLENSPDDPELIASVFRAMHTIKGSGAMFGFDDIANFTHDIETVFDYIREGKLSVTKTIVDLSLSACDLIRQMVDGSALDTAVTGEIVTSFRNLISEDDLSDTPSDAPGKEPSADSGLKKTYRIRFQPHPGIFSSGTNPIFLLDELSCLGHSSVIAHAGAIPSLNEINPEWCYMYWDIILTTDKGINEIKDVFIFVEDECSITIDIIDEEGFSEDDPGYKKLGEILVEHGDASNEDITNALQQHKRIGELLVEKKGVSQDAVSSALTEQQHIRQVRRTRLEQSETTSIRVPAEKLDKLVDLVGELVTVQARLSQKSLSQEDPELTAISEVVERLIGELRDQTMGIRMLPIGTTFARFKRLVRDLSKGLGKDVVLETDGGETELDKTVIERINDPLVHLIRNSIDHGIESPENRKAAGKQPKGTVLLRAAHRAGSVIITVEDDGMGLNAEAIRNKAVEKGLISNDANLTDEDIFSLIFAPGFSTASEVTDISGRGVGMDVVKRSIEDLKGSIQVTSKKNVGTSISFTLPVTLAIIDGLMVKIGDGDYIFPLSSVDECVEMTRQEAEKARKRKMMEVRGKMISYLSLREIFKIKGDCPPYEKIIIAYANANRIGLGVDFVIGQHQTVIKTLGDIYSEVKGISGATIKGDGKVALILDVNSLAQFVN